MLTACTIATCTHIHVYIKYETCACVLTCMYILILPNLLNREKQAKQTKNKKTNINVK